MRRLVYDLKLGRPGCVLLQAALGADYTHNFQLDFPSESWLVAPTPDMKVYNLTDEQYVILIALTELTTRGMTVQEAKAELVRRAQQGH